MSVFSPSRPPARVHSVVVVGGGFGGLKAASVLSNEPGVSVTLVDRRNHHLFQPLLYQVATAGLNPGDIAVPIRAQFSKSRNVEVLRAHAIKARLDKRCVKLEGAPDLNYDYLILACGARHSYFARPDWEEVAPGLKTLEQATEIRRRILSAFEDAEAELDEDKKKALLTFVVVGGGPTGVELAGAIADVARTVLVDDFRRIDPLNAKVVLIEAGPRLVPSFDPSLSERTKKDLEELGVDVRLGLRVEEIDSEGVRAGATRIPTRTAVWAAGVQAAKVEFEPPVAKDRAGRVHVSPDLSIPGFPEAFVVGDMAAASSEDGRQVPGLAPAAIQEGEHAARSILDSIAGRPRRRFRYRDKGQMATIGKNRAIAQSGRWKLTGYVAWLAWLFIHLFYLIGFRNRVAVLLQWAWSYVFSKRGARLITDRDWKASGHDEASTTA